MVQEARLGTLEGGLYPEAAGWFVVNTKEALWWQSEKAGRYVRFEGKDAARLPEFGINIHVLATGEPNCMYHAEDVQEDFLVLSGECLLLVEGEERRLKAWDFVHCPARTEHVFVGAGDGPCAILMVGTRKPDDQVRYPVSELADRYGASVEKETTDPKEAYAGWGELEPVPYREGDLPNT